jgi:hypothetical protein
VVSIDRQVLGIEARHFKTAAEFLDLLLQLCNIFTPFDDPAFMILSDSKFGCVQGTKYL